MSYNNPRKKMKSRWSIKYKKSINCSSPKGFSQKNYCDRQKRGGKYLEGFRDFIEISSNFDFKSLNSNKIGRNSIKIQPESDKFNIIPIKIGYDTYNVFSRYLSPRFSHVERLLDRRGSSVSFVVLKASNEEIANLKELAYYIIKNAPEKLDSRPSYSSKDAEIDTARATLDRIDKALVYSGIKS